MSTGLGWRPSGTRSHVPLWPCPGTCGGMGAGGSGVLCRMHGHSCRWLQWDGAGRGRGVEVGAAHAAERVVDEERQQIRQIVESTDGHSRDSVFAGGGGVGGGGSVNSGGGV